jgi:hypothetical protein
MTFLVKQKFLYAVLEARVETAKGKSIIHKYDSLYDAQKAYAELEDYHLTSNNALFTANKIMEYLTTVQINDGSWYGSLENFINDRQEQFRCYERLVPTASHYKDDQRLAMLQVAVHPLCELRQVKNTALFLKKAGGKDLYVQ